MPSPRLVLPTTARILLVAFTFRLVSAFIAFFANITLPLHTNQGFTVLGRPHPFWDTFARFDSGWYFGIARNGYSYVEGGRNNLAFFPLYPTLMGLGGRLLGGRQEDFYFAGIVISWLAFAAAMVLLYRLARLDLGCDGALRAAAYCAVFPSAHFFGVVYSESLFLLTLVGAVLALRRRQWGWAALSGIAMTATRVNGVMLVPGLLVVAWLSAHPTRGDRLRGLAAAAAASAGVAVFSVYAYAVSGDPLAWYHSIERWGYYPGGNPAIALVRLAGALCARAGPFFQHESDGPRTTPSTCSRPSSRWRCCRWSGGDSTSAMRPSSRSGSCCRSRRAGPGACPLRRGSVSAAAARRQPGRRHEAPRTADRLDHDLHAAPGAVRQRPPALLNAFPFAGRAARPASHDPWRALVV